MPHVIVEYSANIEDKIRVPQLLAALHDAPHQNDGEQNIKKIERRIRHAFVASILTVQKRVVRLRIVPSIACAKSD